VQTSFARPGQVTVVNGGDLVKESGLLPPEATTPEPTSSVLVAPPGQVIRPPASVIASARAVSQGGRSSTVQVVAPVSASEESHGTGIVLDATHVLTNAHVVEGATTGVTVVLPDGRSVNAQTIARDTLSDLAVVTAPLPAGAVQPATFGDGRQLQNGDFVVAVGYTPYFPTPPTTRIGVYGGRDPDVVDQLKTDTYILPGDSGGPLFDLRGRVIGVNSSITIERGQNVTQPLTGFSIDITAAQPLIAELIANGRIARPFLGVSTVSVTPAIAQRFGLPAQNGALVGQVVAGSPAASAGVQSGDAIVGIDGEPVRSTRDLAVILSRHKIGDQVAVALAGPAGRRTPRVTLGTTPG
jgi:serine protease Do